MSEQGNALAAPAPVLPEWHEPMADAIGQAHSTAASQVKKLEEDRAMLDHLRTEFTSLLAMGDNVTPEDVIKAAGALVGKGGDPMALASKLADMPQGGQAIAAWVKQNADSLTASERQVEQQLAVSRHGAGAAALHLLAMHHIASKFQPPAQGAPVAQNAESSNALN